MNGTEINQESPKSVITITLTLTDGGKELIGYSSDTQDNRNIPLVHVRKLLQWGLNHVNDSIMRGMVQMAFNDARKQIIKPGFRPMQIIRNVFGGNGNDAVPK